jgi:hypothetical protein
MKKMERNKAIKISPQKNVGWTRKKPRASYGGRYVVKESHTMMFKFIPQMLMLLALSFYSFRVFNNGELNKYFNIAMIWSVIALISFCFSIMMFVVSSINLGLVYASLFAVSISVSIKFRNAAKTT